VAVFQSRLDRHEMSGEFEQAAKAAEQIATYRRQRQGIPVNV
jgi:hypothetical protein